MKWIEKLFLTFIIVFIILAVFEYDHTAYFFDRLFGALLIGVIWWLWRKCKLSYSIITLVLLALLLHHLKLYGNAYLGIPFDKYMHFFGSFAIALLLNEVIPPIRLKPLIVYAAAIGVGSSIEPLEYYGYATVGSGEGILGYGLGYVV